MRKLLSTAIFVIFAVANCPRPAFGQQGASAGIFGSVVDSQGAIVPAAKVTLVHVTTNQVRTTNADTAGEFRFPLLPVGEYRISVEQPGFKRYE